jgi:FkbM family methyltransferase
MAVVLDAEKTALDLYAEAWYVSGHRGDPFIVDVGANVGEWYVAARERFPLSQIACFEPQAGAQKFLLKHAAGDPRMAVVRMGLSSHDHEATLMADSNQESVLATLHQRSDRHNYHGTGISLDREERVLLTTLDHWIDDEKLPVPDFVKIDVEGHEYAALVGARGCLSGLGEHSTIGVIQVEMNDCARHAGISWGHFLDLLGGRYTVYRQHDEGLTRIVNFSLEGGDEIRNYLFVHKSIDWFPRAGRP